MPLMMTLHLTLPDDAADRVAEVLAAPGTVLELRCLAGPVTARSVRHPSQPAPPPASLPRIIAASAAQFGVTVEQVMGRSRYASIARARQIAMLIAHDRLHMSSVEIGHFLKRDHSTVSENIRYARPTIERDAILKDAVAAILARLDAPGAP
jgi:chromosomal replication initiation ATPase DnaA